MLDKLMLRHGLENALPYPDQPELDTALEAMRESITVNDEAMNELTGALTDIASWYNSRIAGQYIVDVAPGKSGSVAFGTVRSVRAWPNLHKAYIIGTMVICSIDDEICNLSSEVIKYDLNNPSGYGRLRFIDSKDFYKAMTGCIQTGRLDPSITPLYGDDLIKNLVNPHQDKLALAEKEQRDTYLACSNAINVARELCLKKSKYYTDQLSGTFVTNRSSNEFGSIVRIDFDLHDNTNAPNDRVLCNMVSINKDLVMSVSAKTVDPKQLELLTAEEHNKMYLEAARNSRIAKLRLNA